MKIVAFIQARMSSSRLPGKVLKDLFGEPMIFRQIDRLKKSKLLTDIVVVTSLDRSDDILVEECMRRGVQIFRGSLDNVLDRFYQAQQLYVSDYCVRITADCPLLDWDVVDLVVARHVENIVDYTSNTLKPTFPDGLDVEVFSPNLIEKIMSEITTDIEKEHVTYYCHTHQDEFTLLNVNNPNGDQSYYRWTVDNFEDYEFVCAVYRGLYEVNPDFNSKDIMDYLGENEEIYIINKHQIRNGALKKSLLMEGSSEKL